MESNNNNNIIEVNSTIQSPTVPNAFDMTDSDKIEKIAEHFKSIMETLGLD